MAVAAPTVFRKLLKGSFFPLQISVKNTPIFLAKILPFLNNLVPLVQDFVGQSRSGPTKVGVKVAAVLPCFSKPLKWFRFLL